MSQVRGLGGGWRPRVFLTAEWRYLVMLNYEIDAGRLLPFVPAGTELDTFEGRTLISVVGFRFLKTRVLGVAFPLHCNFDEVNLRFYVKRIMPDGGTRRAVSFLREVVARRSIAAIAKLAYNEPYLARPMRSITPRRPTDSPGDVSYRWKSGGTWLQARATATGEPSLPAEGSEAQFITEHYWGYTTQRDGSVIEYEVLHPQWRVWNVGEAELSPGVASFYGPPFDSALCAAAPRSALIAEGSPVKVGFPQTLQ